MKTSLKLVMLTALIFGSGCSHAKNGSESANIMIDMKNAKDWCAGRYTIKIPSTAQSFAGGDKFNSFLIKSKLGANASDLNKAYELIVKEYTNSISKIDLNPPEKKVGSKTVRIFAAKGGTIKGAPSDLYAFILDRNVLFTLNIPYMPDKKQIVLDELDFIISGLSARNSNVIPKEKGVCITNGFIKDDGSKFRRSTHTIAFLDKAHPSVRISLQVDAVSQQLPDLITRTENNLKRDGIAHITKTSFKTIRKGEKQQSAGDKLNGLEWLSTAPMKGQNGVIATWEHGGTAKKSFDPAVKFDFDSGYDGNNIQTSSLNENESIKAYEQILNTIRKF